jgi:hypothetical protein
MKYTGLTDERYTWAFELKHGHWHEPYVLQQYRINRDSNLWRVTREVEKLCEYILHLEGAKPMCERIVVNCDQCDTDISSSPYYPMFRLRLSEETRSISEGAQPSQAQPELERMMNFCNLECLQGWLQK